MTTYEIKRLIVVAAVASLPIACGTTSPMSSDVAAIEADFSASALRVQPEGPIAPGSGSETAPIPEAPTSEVPAPVVKDDPTTVEVPVAPEPTRRRPTPQPSTSPNDDASIPTPPNVPAPPAPPTGPSTETPEVQCLAASIEIATMTLFAAPNEVALEAILLGKDGLAITDSSCEKVLWDVDSSALGTDRVIITYGANSRFVTVTGPAGTYTINAITPNKQTDALVITLP